MTGLHRDEIPIPESRERTIAPVEQNSSDNRYCEYDERSDPFPGSIEEFLLDRFSTKLADPRTGRKIIYPAEYVRCPMLSTRTKADFEYAVMLAVLNFQKEFMQSNYSLVQVQLRENLIEVDLTRTAPVPAEQRLALTQEGREQLRRMHQALFTAGQDILKKQLEEILGRKIYKMVTDLEPLSGKNTIVIRLEEAIDSSA